MTSVKDSGDPPGADQVMVYGGTPPMIAAVHVSGMPAQGGGSQATTSVSGGAKALLETVTTRLIKKMAVGTNCSHRVGIAKNDLGNFNTSSRPSFHALIGAGIRLDTIGLSSGDIFIAFFFLRIFIALVRGRRQV